MLGHGGASFSAGGSGHGRRAARLPPPTQTGLRPPVAASSAAATIPSAGTSRRIPFVACVTWSTPARRGSQGTLWGRSAPAALALLEERCDQRRRPRGAVRLDGPVVDLLPDRLGDRRGDRLRASRARSPCSARRRSARAGGGRGSSARSGGGAGSRGTVAGSRSAPSTSSARPGRPRGRRRRGAGRARGRRHEPRARRARAATAGSMRGPGDHDHPQRRHPLLRLREGGDHPPQQVRRRRPSRRP